MASLAASDITVTVLDRKIYGRQRQNLVKLVFGNSTLTYPSGGVPFPSAAALGLKTPLTFLQLFDDSTAASSYWKPDYANSKLRGFRDGHIPAIVIEEAVTLTSNVGTLKYLPAYIICAVGTISAAVTPLRPIPAGTTPATLQMAVSFTAGTVTTLSSDSVTACKVSYIPQQASGPFASTNLVIDEVVTAATGNVNLANAAAAIQYLYQTTATAARLPIAHVNASGVVAVDIVNSTNTTISFNSAQNAKSVKVTYLKLSGFTNNAAGTAVIDQASITLTSQAREWGKTAGDFVGGLYLPAFGGQVVGKEGSNYLSIYLGDSTATAGVAIAKYEIAKQKITTAETTAQTTLEDTPLLFLNPLLTPQRTDNELTVNDAPVSTTLYGLAYGG